MVQPINLLFRFLQNQNRVQIWLSNVRNKRIEGVIRGFDEYMNLVLEDAADVNVRLKTCHKLGIILLRGDNIALVQSLPEHG